MRKIKKGSITVEAALVVPIFAFAMLTLAFVMRLVYVDEVMENSLNHAANSISQYSYLYQKCGLKDTIDGVDEAMGNSADKANRQKEAILNGLPKINEIQTGVASSIDIDDIKSRLDGLNADGSNFEEIMQTAKDDAKAGAIDFAKNEALMLLFAVGNQYKEQVFSAVDRAIAKQLFLMDLQTGTESYQSKLARMNILGADGNTASATNGAALSFEGSESNNGSDIKLVLSYKVKLPFPLFMKREFDVRNQVRVLAWIGN